MMGPDNLPEYNYDPYDDYDPYEEASQADRDEYYEELAREEEEERAIKYSKRGIPLTRCSETMTEAAFFGWIRSALRRLSVKWRPKSEYLDSKKSKYVGDNKRLKWQYECCHCEAQVPRKEYEVNHIIECGSLTCFADVGPFCERLFCEKDGYEGLCLSCHQKVTNAQRVRRSNEEV